MIHTPLEIQLLDQRHAVMAYIVALTRDHAAAEEVFQELALSVLQESRKGATVTNFLSWVRKMVRNRVADYYRSGRRRTSIVQLTDSMTEVIGRSLDEHAVSTERAQLRRQLVLECIAHLKGHPQKIMEARYRNGKNLFEISTMFNRNISAVKMALVRSRRAVMACVQSKLQTQEEC